MHDNRFSDSSPVYQIKVSLRGISPMIWRRLLVESGTTLFQLHQIIQIAMGWEDGCLHRFRVHCKDYGSDVLGDCDRNLRLSELQLRPSERFLYEYDFFSFWKHDVRLEKVLPYESEHSYPTCLDGSRACPPVHCRGPMDYMNWLEKYNSFDALLEYNEAAVTILQAVQVFLDGGKRPTYEDEDFMQAKDILEFRMENEPEKFECQETNEALLQLKELT